MTPWYLSIKIILLTLLRYFHNPVLLCIWDCSGCSHYWPPCKLDTQPQPNVSLWLWGVSPSKILLPFCAQCTLPETDFNVTVHYSDAWLDSIMRQVYFQSNLNLFSAGGSVQTLIQGIIICTPNAIGITVSGAPTLSLWIPNYHMHHDSWLFCVGLRKGIKTRGKFSFLTPSPSIFTAGLPPG